MCGVYHIQTKVPERDSSSQIAGSRSALVPRVKRAVRSLDTGVCLKLVEEVLCLESSTEILAKCEEVARAHYPELLS